MRLFTEAWDAVRFLNNLPTVGGGIQTWRYKMQHFAFRAIEISASEKRIHAHVLLWPDDNSDDAPPVYALHAIERTFDAAVVSLANQAQIKLVWNSATG